MTFGSISSFAVEYYGSSYAPQILNITTLALSPIGFLVICVLNRRDGLRISVRELWYLFCIFPR
jgi:hypothetical protein